MDDEILAKVDKFFSKYKLRQYDKGQVLMLGGDTAQNVYYLVEGRVKVYDVSKRGDELIVNIFKPPAFFPMSMAMNESENKFIYEADTKISIRQAPPREVIVFLKANPDVIYDLLARVYRGVDGLLGRISQLMGSNASSRLIFELDQECQRFGALQDNGVCILGITEKDLAARAGLTRETVSREVAKLKAEGVLDIKDKKIHIKDIKSLRERLDESI